MLHRSSWAKAIFRGAVLSVCLAVGAVPSAVAGEMSYGHQDFYIKHWDMGTQDRSMFNWYDDASSPAGTWIFLYGCYFAPNWRGNPEPILQLRRHRANKVDVNLGNRTFKPCTTGSSQNWGNQSAGRYHFDVVDIDAVLSGRSATQLNVTRTRVTW